MKFVTSREIRANPATLWEVRDSGETVITVNGRPTALVIPVGDDLENTIATVRKARASAALERIRLFARERGLDALSNDEIGREIAKSRKRR
jgi:prevent-host-death family protein